MSEIFFDKNERKIVHNLIRINLKNSGFPKGIDHLNLKRWSNKKQRWLEY